MELTMNGEMLENRDDPVCSIHTNEGVETRVGKENGSLSTVVEERGGSAIEVVGGGGGLAKWGVVST